MSRALAAAVDAARALAQQSSKVADPQDRSYIALSREVQPFNSGLSGGSTAGAAGGSFWVGLFLLTIVGMLSVAGIVWLKLRDRRESAQNAMELANTPTVHTNGSARTTRATLASSMSSIQETMAAQESSSARPSRSTLKSAIQQASDDAAPPKKKTHTKVTFVEPEKRESVESADVELGAGSESRASVEVNGVHQGEPEERGGPVLHRIHSPYDPNAVPTVAGGDESIDRRRSLSAWYDAKDDNVVRRQDSDSKTNSRKGSLSDWYFEDNSRSPDDPAETDEKECYNLDQSAADGRRTIVAATSVPDAYSMNGGESPDQSPAVTSRVASFSISEDDEEVVKSEAPSDQEATTSVGASESIAVTDIATENSASEPNGKSEVKGVPSWANEEF